jgi:hypothetical protein
MHPTLVSRPFHREGWIYEEKVDGWRMLAYKDGAAVKLVSRQGVDHAPLPGHRGRHPGHAPKGCPCGPEGHSAPAVSAQAADHEGPPEAIQLDLAPCPRWRRAL